MNKNSLNNTKLRKSKKQLGIQICTISFIMHYFKGKEEIKKITINKKSLTFEHFFNLQSI